jgi:hypothetical protein
VPSGTGLEHPRALGRAVDRRQRDGADRHRERVGAAAGVPQQPRQPRVLPSGSLRLGELDGALRDRDRELSLAGCTCGLGGALGELHLVELHGRTVSAGGLTTTASLGRRALPQLEGVLEVPQRFGMRVDALSLTSGPDRGDQRALRLAGRVPVVGELTRERRTPELGVRLQLARQHGVQRLALARQQIRVGRLT